jgi:hypothetical protein
LALLLVTPASAIDFIADDGNANFNTGPSFDGTDFLWGNTFVADGPTRIDTVSVSFGNLPLETPFEFLVYDDPTNDGNPADAVLVGSVSGLTDQINANTPGDDVFSTLSFIDGPIVDGGFFVATFVSGVDGVSGDAPARRDGDNATGQGFVFFGPEGESDLNELSAFPAVIPVGDPTVFGGLAGNVLVRATGTLVPEPAVLATIGLTGMTLLRRR